ncbi:hypothetical protein ACNKHT_23285 [Shigella flexneri]
MKWHDNKEFKPTRELNADDVVFSFDRQKTRKTRTIKFLAVATNIQRHGLAGADQRSEKVDDNTVQFVLARRKRRSSLIWQWTSPLFCQRIC